ncbi:DUF2288 domain-containing protein [Lusitaniella coriacea LEGE 07157]|uniref:DUF2288 domain-containing protein n=1 Tax=Lusitaniella coriacea LEGE 07157 TaxID=945747 RepID=A0A8J7DXW4_9CYAN|nr:DUF2288 domain-containing protein [Lusitaniella coriacea]MBE9116448.1 DUF2288 domain-containing protein [Lusitaniella coriacea LEGE 07157]
MTVELREELAQSLDEAEWDWLMPHAKRDVVIVVSPDLNLLDVGVAIANDNATLVQSWIGTQQVHKPSADELNTWNQNPSKRFNTLIVQPFVVVQEWTEKTTPS